jgi:hypothetical protein
MNAAPFWTAGPCALRKKKQVLLLFCIQLILFVSHFHPGGTQGRYNKIERNHRESNKIENHHRLDSRRRFFCSISILHYQKQDVS